MFVVDWARWEKPPAADDTPKGGEQVPGPVQSIPQHNLRAPVATFMMSWESGRAVQSILREDFPMTRMMSWESGRAGIPKQPQLDSGAGEAAAD